MKKVFLAVLVFMAAAVFAGCKSGSNLSDPFNEADVKAKAQEAIDMFNEKDYQGIIDMGNDDLKAALTVDKFSQSGDPVLEQLGDFDSMEKFVIAGQQGNDKKNYAAVVAIGKYANAKLQFTLAFDESMKLAQFYISNPE